MTLLERHEAVTSYDDPGVVPERPRRRRRRTVGLLVVVGLLAGWALLPLTLRLGQDVTPELPVGAGLLVPEYGPDGTYGLRYRHRETVTITVPVRNRGPLPLRIDHADLDSDLLPLLVPAGDNLPLRIGPWQEADVTLTLRFDNCRYYHERSADTWDHVDVGGSVLGRAFRTEVTLAYPLALHGQVINNCPDRTLTRGDEVRPLR